MDADSATQTIITTGLEQAYRHALAALVPGDGAFDSAGPVQVFLGEWETPGAALEDAIEAIREISGMLGGAPARVDYEGSLRTDDGYRVWGTLTLGDGDVSAMAGADVRIEAGEEGTWTVTMTRR